MIRDPLPWLGLGIATLIMVGGKHVMNAPRSPSLDQAKAVCTRTPPCESVELVAYRITPESYGLRKQTAFKVVVGSRFNEPSRKEAYRQAFVDASLAEMGSQLLPRIAPDIELVEPKPAKGKSAKR